MRRFLLFPLTRIVIAAGVIFLPFIALQMALDASGRNLPGWLDAAIITALSVLALWILARFIERRKLSEVGLARTGAVTQTLLGIGVGALLMGTTLGILALAGWYHVDGIAADSAGAALALLAPAFGGILLSAAFEEIAFRGIVFRVIEDGAGTVIALLLSSAAFGLAHAQNPAATWFSSLAIAVEAGILLGAAFLLTRTLWFAIGIHAGWNFFLGPVFGAAVSGVEMTSLLEARLDGPTLWTGGSFGPEASLVTVLLCTAVGAAFLAVAVRRGRRVPFRWRRRAAEAGSAATALPPS